MSHRPCHEAPTDYRTTEAVRWCCGTCGGDRRRPVRESTLRELGR